jgi:hypothetical protein
MTQTCSMLRNKKQPPSTMTAFNFRIMRNVSTTRQRTAATDRLVKDGYIRQAMISPDSLGDVVDVLRLDGRLQLILENAREVVLQLAAPEVGEDLLPVRRRL